MFGRAVKGFANILPIKKCQFLKVTKYKRNVHSVPIPSLLESEPLGETVSVKVNR